MSEFLFNKFEPVTSKQWKQKIQADLKGADYNETLVWQSLEGIHVKPIYHADDFEADFTPIPGHPKKWNIAQAVFIDDTKIAHNLIIDAIERGAEAISISSEKEFDPTQVFEAFPFEKAAIYCHFTFLSEKFILQLKDFFTNKNATVYYNIDLIGNLARTGNWFYNLNEDHQILDRIFQKNSSENLLSIDASLYQNAGANSIQQLAYALAHANEYLNHFYNNDKEVSEKQGTLTFHFAVGPNYFFEIAKIRAFRKLYAALASEYNCLKTCHIVATPSKRNKTLYDYNVNMLRTTTECMSAILGGANTVSNMPYDALYHKSNEFGERISRNQLLILKAESYFDTVSNPADGTYYIENLTNELAEKALALFKSIEANGGFLHQLKEGTIQRKIKESADKEQQLFDTGTLVLLGTNKHPNTNDRMKDDLELYPFVKTNVRKTLISPIIERRLSEKIEKERIEKE
ncbi:methylmalonyl-CoA mutase subunit beta [Ulvibacter litoralis]|uniref:Methylmalonyl-CoA mutase n=1 Tax=Ulvibacter litoralis TaxID=227084 RepID=A0A1G7EUE6_9FLAO|nr:methylmalonyl-CoA mutase subunit beta [Ulvibacter litoralis]GHC53874.1 methylmalonyl-CoA mutase [Ulvibacter litoralis]SDE67278.1 methylmalonyl-CoA mutase [Ulvibacter litoralis]